ncbi:MAG TPA: hypothetical protein VHG72_21715 [Polyangia bacterium]|nr:hypothetical protein [Polyangia bacterium]
MTSYEIVLEAARRKYHIATDAFRAQRELGDITELDPAIPEDSDELAKGVKLKCLTPVARVVMGIWQRNNAELQAAAANVAWERGKKTCPICPAIEAPSGPDPGRHAPAVTGSTAADLRLPPELEEDPVDVADAAGAGVPF